MKETHIRAKIKKALNKMPLTKVAVQHGSIFSTHGEPDIIGCHRGKSFVMEIKQPDGDLRPTQPYRLQQWKKSGSLVGVVRSVDEAVQMIVKWKGNFP